MESLSESSCSKILEKLVVFRGSDGSGQCTNGCLLSCIAHPVEEHQVTSLTLVATPCMGE